MELKNKKLYYIGGIVRDELIGSKSFDIDLTYCGNAIDFVKTIPNAQIIQTNEPFGTIRIRYNDEFIDIASTRSEYYPKNGHLPVINRIGCSLKEDILRRDFTINSLAKSTFNGEIIDYVGGVKDIKNKILRVLHDKSFEQDPTRIVRGLKFSVRFGFNLDDRTRQLQDTYLKNVNYDMSYKRLKKELVETFNLNSYKAFEMFISQKIYKLLSPEYFEIPKYDFSYLIEKYRPQNIWIIYIGLLQDISCLPLTKVEKKIVDDFNKLKATNLDTDFDIYKNFSSVNLESVIMYSTVSSIKVERYFEKLKAIKISITGEDLKNIGLEPSKIYQECFDVVLKEKIKNPSMIPIEELNVVKKYLNIV